MFRRQEHSATGRGLQAPVVALASGKGGTGKSFLATNLAIALQRSGCRAVLVDCDFGLANAHLLLGCNPALGLQQLLAGTAHVSQLVTPTSHGPALVAGGSGLAALADLDLPEMRRLGEALDWLAARYDAVLLDCPAGLSPQALATVLAASHVLVVTNPEIAALTDAYALIKCLARQPAAPPSAVAVNRCSQPALGPATFARLADVALRFAGLPIHYLGTVPEDPAVIQRRLGQPPLMVGNPQCTTSAAILQVAAALATWVGGWQRLATNGQGVAERLLAQLRRW